MKLLATLSTRVSYPTGSKLFAVEQAFPGAGLTPEQTDPFLMCDFFGPTISQGVETNPDQFPVGWHPHRGMDVVTYLIEGVGRHADSMGNRETFNSPGMQWCRTGSGIEHAEGGGTPAGQPNTGFQIWINSPSNRKMDNPAYGTESSEHIPVLTSLGASVRLLCGELGGRAGPLQPSHENGVQLLDVNLNAQSVWEHVLPVGFDTLFVLVYSGSGVVLPNRQPVHKNGVLWFDATSPTHRSFAIQSSEPMSFLVFAGRKLHQPVAWHGPFVMTTQREIDQTIYEYQRGTFLKQRANWDYKRLATKGFKADL
ncbi:hypothetical protein BASA81_001087 [Batrachochytrium salamandrivorans]|nr:hypothetical protein BASA81_001087 [Batrachochytrium salamandrivorans]